MGKKTDAEKAEMYRRQLGGTNAALRRERQKVKDMERRERAMEELLVDMRRCLDGDRFDDDLDYFDEQMDALGIGWV